jgi:MFS transporter, DHA1 family, multidrug resistance protein
MNIITENPPPLNWKRNLAFAWLAQFLATVGFCFTAPFIPFYMESLGVTNPESLNMWVALFAAAGYLPFCIFAPIWGFLADIYGRRIMMLRANFVCAICMVFMAFVPSVGWLVVIRFLVGMFSGTVTASQMLVSANTPHAHRGFALGTMSSAVYGGSMGGTFLGGIIVDNFGYRNAFFACGLTLAIAGLLVIFGVKETFHKTSTIGEKLNKFQFKLPKFGTVWLILLLVLLMGFVGRFTNPYLAILVEKINGPDKAATWTGIIASISAVAGIISGSFLGWLADRTSAPKVAMWSALLAGLLLIPQGLAGTLALLMTARFGMVFFAGGLDPIFQIWLAKSTPDNKRGLFFGWASSAKSFGWFISSLSGGAVAMCLGVRWVYLFAAIMFLLLIPIIKVIMVLLKPNTELQSKS